MSGTLEIRGSMSLRGSLRREPFRAADFRLVGASSDQGRHLHGSQKTCIHSLHIRSLEVETSDRLRSLRVARTSRQLGKVVPLTAGLSSSNHPALALRQSSHKRGPHVLRSTFKGELLLRVCGEPPAGKEQRKGRGSALGEGC